MKRNVDRVCRDRMITGVIDIIFPIVNLGDLP